MLIGLHYSLGGLTAASFRGDSNKMSEVPKPEAVSKKSGHSKFLIFGCLPLVLLCFMTPWALTLMAQADLDEKVAFLEKDLAEYRRKQSFDRAPRFKPAMNGNAVDYYNALEYVTITRKSWETSPPVNLPELGLLKAYVGGNGPDYSKVLTKLSATLRRSCRNREDSAESRLGRKLSDEDREVIKAYRSMLKFVEDGLRCQRVQWPAEFEQGQAMPIPSLESARLPTVLLAHQARTAEGAKKLDYAFQIIAFGEDYSRGPTAVMKMMGDSIKNSGYRSLQEAMESPLRDADYRRILRFLGSVYIADASETMHEEYLASACTLARLGTLKVNGQEVNEVSDFEFPMSIAGTTSFIVNREWSYYIELNENYMKPMCQLRGARLDARGEELEKDVVDRWMMFASVTAPTYLDVLRQLIRSENAPRIVALLAAAHLHRLKTGQFSKTADALKEFFPGNKLPLNTLSSKTTSFDYELKNGQVTVSVPGEPELIYRTWMPK